MTHILIPISLIEERIKLSEKEEEICKQSDFELAGQAARNRASFYRMLLSDINCKQISLTEEDIQAEARSFQIERGTEYENIPSLIRECYKQALKDLL